MERNEFIRRLGMVAMLPVIVSCATEDEPGSSNGTCAVTRSETEGPFPTHSPSGLQITDIRSDRTGIDLSIDIQIMNESAGCTALAGAIVDIWHCDKDGYYSEYGGTGMQSANFTSAHFLRGRQVSGSDGKVKFLSIFPGWYNGRSTHIHVHVYNSSGKSLLVTQIAFPEGTNSAVAQVNAATAKGYTKGMSGYTPNGSDNVFSDGVADEMSAIEGSVANGFSLSHSIVVAS